MSRRATQRDVAKRAGVSPATVSYIVNNRTEGNIRVSEDTRQRVLDAIQELRYLPDITARGLSTRRTQLLALLLPDITDPLDSLVFRGAQSITEVQGYDLMVYDLHSQVQREQKFLNAVMRRRVEGVILVNTFTTSQVVQKLKEAGIQVAIVGPSPAVKGVDRVVLDELDGVLQVMEHLFERGRTRIAFLGGPQSWQIGRDRKLGYERSLQKLGLRYDEKLVREGNFERGGTAGQVKSLFGNGPRQNFPTALFCANDSMAIEAVGTLIKMGFNVPEDVAVAGFGNFPQAEMMIPALTSIGFNALQMGEAAASFLLERLESENELKGRNKILTGKLIIRETT